jgi:2,5-dioxopentanoate dehydrogenase
VEKALSGLSIIGHGRGEPNEHTFLAFDPSSATQVGPEFFSASMDELNRAVGLANGSRAEFAKLPPNQRASFLRQIAQNIEELGETLVARASLETALPAARIESERGRTCFQLRLFADLVEEGSWVEARIDLPDPNRLPIPKPDLRSMLVPLGPVAVFCASNFPLAYSVGGGDTASAFAAGCPVIVNAHPAHPGTAELVGLAIADAVKSCGLPEGVFSLLFSGDYEIGQALVRHPEIKAVGFTGSRAGGRALMDIAAARPEPIPMYCEMGSVNPTFILPGALAERTAAIASGLHASFTLGGGQFCTKPGLVILPESPSLSGFTAKMETLTNETAKATLLTPGIKANYEKGVDKRAEKVVSRTETSAAEGTAVEATVFQTTAEQFLREPELAAEIFGPTTLMVVAGTNESLIEVARSLEGQLTAAVFGSEDDLVEFADLIAILETKAGRLIFNGFPTGVEVGHAIVHGGPYPATSDSRSTSVGTRAVSRFSRLVCYQGFPQNALPDELKDENPGGIWRMIDGKLSSGSIRRTG